MIQWLDDEDDFLFILASFIKHHNRDLTGIEPIPWPTMEAAQAAAATALNVNASIFGKELYPGRNRKLAVLFYELAKRHFFVNGNKRIAVFFLLFVARMNNLAVEGANLVKLAEDVAESDPAKRANVLRRISLILHHRLKPLPQSAA